MDCFLTIVAKNYLPYAATLMGSAEIHFAEYPRFIVVTDVDGDTSEIQNLIKSARILTLIDIGFSASEIDQRREIYNIVELATSVKARALISLLVDYESVTYLDPDVFIYSDFRSMLASKSVPLVLTPHRLTPTPLDGLYPSELDLRRFGVFNLGFASTHRLTLPFLEWWDSRLSLWSADKPYEGFYTDQSWMDFAPALTETTVSKSKTMNVAPWNIDERPIELTDKGPRVEGEPLSFVHFSSVGSNLSSPDAILSIEVDWHRDQYLPSAKSVFRSLAEEWWSVVEDWRGRLHSETMAINSSSQTKLATSRLERDLYRGALTRETIKRQEPSAIRVKRVPLSGSKIFEKLYGLSTSQALVAGVRADLQRFRRQYKGYRANFVTIRKVRRRRRP